MLDRVARHDERRSGEGPGCVAGRRPRPAHRDKQALRFMSEGAPHERAPRHPRSRGQTGLRGAGCARRCAAPGRSAPTESARRNGDLRARPAALALGTLVRVFERSEPQPALPPKITEENVGDLRMAWNASARRMLPPADGERRPRLRRMERRDHGVRGVLRDRGGTCEHIWVGTVTDVTHRPVTTTVDYKADHLEAPVVSDGMVFSVDKHHLYAFPVDCATDGATCQLSWFACPQRRSTHRPPGIADGLVFKGTGDGHLFGYPTHCGTGAMVCEPTWIAHGDGQRGIGDGVV